MSAWVTSSFCSLGDCVRVRKSKHGKIAVRDEHGNEVNVSEQEWREFIEGVKAGEFDYEALPQPQRAED